jgi:hypothetical protein
MYYKRNKNVEQIPSVGTTPHESWVALNLYEAPFLYEFEIWFINRRSYF